MENEQHLHITVEVELDSQTNRILTDKPWKVEKNLYIASSQSFYVTVNFVEEASHSVDNRSFFHAVQEFRAVLSLLFLAFEQIF